MSPLSQWRIFGFSALHLSKDRWTKLKKVSSLSRLEVFPVIQILFLLRNCIRQLNKAHFGAYFGWVAPFLRPGLFARPPLACQAAGHLGKGGHIYSVLGLMYFPFVSLAARKEIMHAINLFWPTNFVPRSFLIHQSSPGGGICSKIGRKTLVKVCVAWQIWLISHPSYFLTLAKFTHNFPLKLDH